MARTNQIDYPTTIGDKRLALWKHAGPASYTQVVNGNPATGGDPITLGELQAAGLKSADQLTALMTSDNGQFEINVVPVAGGQNSSFGVGPMFGPNPATVVARLRWIVSATGAEAAALTNLASRTVMLMAIGPK